jgi:phosphoglycerate kinase
MMFSFWKAMGRSIGNSLVDDSLLDDCAELLKTGRIELPVDVVTLPTGSPFGAGGAEMPEIQHDVPDGFVGLDIGPESVARFRDLLLEAGTILWNGPMGVFEDERLASGTRGVAQAVADASAVSVIGGGDSAAAVAKFGLGESMDFISTGGGASLELVEYGDLPGLRALREGVR